MNNTDYNVLALFDGMSCGQMALDELGIKVTNYYASEIDKYAMKVTMANYPDTKQLGSVVDVDGYKLPPITLLIGGSPCQSFSFAGKRKGMATKDEQEILTLDHYLQLKADGYEFEGQSYLFWEYMRLLNEVKPKYFLLENVMMGEKWEKILSKAIGVNGIHINSALVSAQNRRRVYWTNIGMQPMGLFGDMESIIKQPKDRGVLLKDILETNVDKKYDLSEKALKFVTDEWRQKKQYTSLDGEKALCHLARSPMNWCGTHVTVHNTMPLSSTTGKGGTGPLSRTDGKTYCLDTGNTNAIEIVGAIKFGRTDEAKAIRKESMENGKDFTPFQAKEISNIDYDKMGTLTTAPNKYNLVIQINQSKESGGKQPYQQNRVYDTNGISHCLNAGSISPAILQIGHGFNKGGEYTDKAPTMTSNCWQNNNFLKSGTIRRLTPRECARLQTVPEHIIDIMLNCGVKDTQLYKMLGNGWTIEVIKYILSYLPNHPKKEK